MNPTGYAIQDVRFGDLLVATGTPVFVEWEFHWKWGGVWLFLCFFVFFRCFFFPFFGVMLATTVECNWIFSYVFAETAFFVDTFQLRFFVCTIWDLWNSVINMVKPRTGACFLNGPAHGELKEFSSSHWPKIICLWEKSMWTLENLYCQVATVSSSTLRV